MADWRQNYSQYRRYFFDILSLYKRRQDLRAFLEILLSIGTITLFIIFAVRPTVVTISQLLIELKNKEDTIAALEQKIINLQVARNVLIQNQAAVDLLKTAIPDSPTPEVELRQVEGLTKKNNVSILGQNTGEVVLVGTQPPAKVDPSLKVFPPNANSYTFSGTFTGDFQSLIGFLTDVENLRRPMLVDGVTFSSVPSEGSQRIILSLSGRVPFVAKATPSPSPTAINQ